MNLALLTYRKIRKELQGLLFLKNSKFMKFSHFKLPFVVQKMAQILYSQIIKNLVVSCAKV